MATPTKAEFRAQFPDITLEDAVLDRLIAEAVQIHSVRKLATLYVVAHLWQLEELETTGEGVRGERKSEAAGPLKASYVTQAENGAEAFFTTTKYGRRFLALERRSAPLVVTARVVG